MDRLMRRLNGSLSRSVRRSVQDIFQQSPLDLRFALQKTLDPRVTFTRASSGTFVGSDGLIQTATTNEARFDHNPTTGESLGLLVEEPRTNSLTNNTMVGAVAGTPGTIPTGWPFQTAGVLGLAVSIVGTGAESGVAYLDWRVSGTASAATGATISFGRGSALTAQTWTVSSYLKLAAGSLSGVTGMTLDLIEETAANVFITGAGYSISLPTTASLIIQRPTASRTLTGGATVAQLRTNLTVNVSSGSTVDFTLRIGLPQLEQGAFATSVIPTTSATVTRAADVASITGSNFNSWYNQTEGTVFADASGVNNISGATRRYLEIRDTAASDRLVLGYATTTSNRFLVIDGGATVADVSVASLPTAKAAGAYKVNSFQLASNGVLGTEDNVGVVPTPDQLQIGSQEGSTANTFLNGTIKRLTYFPTRLANTTLQQITQP